MIIGRKARNRVLGIALALALVLAMLPLSAVTAYAAGTAEIVNDVLYLDEDGNEQTRDNVMVLTGSETTLGAGWYLARGELTFSGRINVEADADVHLILEDNADITANGGIGVAGGQSLTIYAQSTGGSKGSIFAKNLDGDGYNAGIGGSMQRSVGTVTINGGAVTAFGGDFGAAIGGAQLSSGGMVTINGGTVTATGGAQSAGIGGGQASSGITVTINGGAVTATGGEFGAGIGGSAGAVTINGGAVTATGGTFGTGIGGAGSSPVGTVTINGGTVTATGGEFGAGIGGSAGAVTINSGAVTATGGRFGAGIGGGSSSSVGTVTINGGAVTATGGEFSAGIGGGSSSTVGMLAMKGDAMVFASSVNKVSNTDKTGGILFNGAIGEVYGDMVLPSDLELSQETTFTIMHGVNLTVPQDITLTNDGMIINNGTIINSGSIVNNGTIINNGEIRGAGISGRVISQDIPVYYNTDDIAAINGFIEDNGLNWMKANPANGSYVPMDWTGITWSDSALNKRAVELRFKGQPLTGTPEVGDLAHLVKLSVVGTQITGMDVSGLGYLEELEVNGNSQLTELNIGGMGSLARLFCAYNEQLASLDLSGLDALKYLNCSGNDILASLELSGLVSLSHLECSENGQLASLNVGGLISLENMYCSYNRLDELDVSGLRSLKNLDCVGNRLAALDASSLASLESLYCYNNRLTELDVSDLTSLTELNCDNNRLAELDVRGLTSLRYLSCRNNKLTALNLSSPNPIDSFYGTGQTASLDMAGNGGVYSAEVTMGAGTDFSGDNGALTYSDGTLTSTDSTVTAPTFTSPTGNGSFALTGTLYLGYPGALPIYDPDDIAVINSLIENNGMLGPPAEPADGRYVPEDWEWRIDWSDVATGKRVTELSIMDQYSVGLYGEVDVSGLTALKSLDTVGVSRNSMSALNVSGLTNLERLDCHEGLLTELDVSGLTSLQYLACYNNMLTSLDLSGLNDLNYLACHNNELTSLNISGLTLLEFLVCSNNRLTALDLVGLDSLTAFYGDDQAASLTLYGNGESYVGRVAMGEGATFGSSSLSYDRSVGKLTSTDRNAGSSMFTSPTGKEGMNLTGTLTLRYADKSTPTKDDLDYQLEAVLGASNVYNGNPQPIDHCRAAGGVTGLGSITIYYEGANGTVYEKSDTPPTEAGAYAVSVDIAEGETYTSASGIGLGTYTIVKASDPPVGGNPDGNPNGGGQTATQPAVKTDISGATVTVAEPVSWTGRQITPKVKVELGGRALTEGMDYTVSYGANKNIGRGSVTVSGSGDYAGAKTAEFKILPQKVKLSKIKAAKGQLKITWKKAKAAQKLTGYQIRYRASQGKSWGKWKTKTVTVGKKALTIKRLAKGKKYQVQIRAYKKIGKEKYCAPWSATKKSGRVK